MKNEKFFFFFLFLLYVYSICFQPYYYDTCLLACMYIYFYMTLVHIKRKLYNEIVHSSKLVPRQIDGTSIWIRERPEPLPCHHAIIKLPVSTDVTVGEGREAAEKATSEQQSSTEDLVCYGALSGVGQQRIQELEHKNCTSWQKLYQISKPLKSLLSYALVLILVFACHFSQSWFTLLYT